MIVLAFKKRVIYIENVILKTNCGLSVLRKLGVVTKRIGYVLLLGIMLVFGGATSKVIAAKITCPKGMSQLDCDSVLRNGPRWVPDNGLSCGTAGDISSDTFTATSGASGGFTIDQVKTFASEPVTSTWNIPDGTAEQWFLKQPGARATVGKYHLNSSNISNITSAVKAANVSPVFFYLYTVNEGGGAGGFINHYPGDTGGGGQADAKRDAEYLASQSKVTNGSPATGGGEPANMPTAEAKQILDALPSGSIGVVYIQATSAVTAELETLSGKGPVNSYYGKPLSDSMKHIKSMGGDPLQGGATILTASCTSTITGEGMAKGISFAIFIANNSGYGYDQATRASGWQKYQSDPSCTHACGSLDCSSFVSAILTVAGYFKTNPEFATGTEPSELEHAGFTPVANSAHTSNGLRPGDILIADSHHTEMYIGNGKDVRASENEFDGINGGKVGDQTGKEIQVVPFNDDAWDAVYRAPN